MDRAQSRLFAEFFPRLIENRARGREGTTIDGGANLEKEIIGRNSRGKKRKKVRHRKFVSPVVDYIRRKVISKLMQRELV